MGPNRFFLNVRFLVLAKAAVSQGIQCSEFLLWVPTSGFHTCRFTNGRHSGCFAVRLLYLSICMLCPES